MTPRGEPAGYGHRGDSGVSSGAWEKGTAWSWSSGRLCMPRCMPSAPALLDVKGGLPVGDRLSPTMAESCITWIRSGSRAAVGSANIVAHCAQGAEKGARRKGVPCLDPVPAMPETGLHIDDEAGSKQDGPSSRGGADGSIPEMLLVGKRIDGRRGQAVQAGMSSASRAVCTVL